MDKKNSTDKTLPCLATFGIGIAAGLLAGSIVARRLSSQSPVEQKWGKSFSLWTQLLSDKMGQVKASFIAGKIRERYNTLYSQRPVFKQTSIQKHLDGKFLPGIVLYQVLLEELGDPSKALNCVDELFAAQMAGSTERKQLMMMQYLPNPFAVMSKASQLQMAMAFPKEGWTLKVVADTPDLLGFDTTHCIYVDILQAYGLPELAPSFCKNDEYLMRDIPPYARFERTQTLGCGDPVCNFRYHKINTPI